MDVTIKTTGKTGRPFQNFGRRDLRCHECRAWIRGASVEFPKFDSDGNLDKNIFAGDFYARKILRSGTMWEKNVRTFSMDICVACRDEIADRYADFVKETGEISFTQTGSLSRRTVRMKRKHEERTHK